MAEVALQFLDGVALGRDFVELCVAEAGGVQQYMVGGGVIGFKFGSMNVWSRELRR